MSALTERGVTWLAIAALYLAAQLAGDYLCLWAGTWPGRPGEWVAALRNSRYAHELGTAGEFIYLLGIPYIALLTGVADARALGLVGLTWWPRALTGGAVGLGGVLLMAWSWRRVAAIHRQRSGRRQVLRAEWQALRMPWGWVPLAAQVLCLQMSWAFVRGGAVKLLGLYTGVFVGLALLGIAWFLRPGRWASLADPDSRATDLVTASLAVITSLVFLYSENLWLCGLIHALGLGLVLLVVSTARTPGVA